MLYISCQTDFYFYATLKILILKILKHWINEFSCFLEISHWKQLLLLIFFLHHNHKNYDPLKFDQLITFFFCYLLQKSQLKFLKMRKKFFFQTKSWISACCHCIKKAHANHLLFSHHAVCIKDFTKNKTDPLLGSRKFKRTKNAFFP